MATTTPTATEPFLMTLPTRASDRTYIPDGWLVLQVGRSQQGSCTSRIGFVCYDPTLHDVAIWLSLCPIATEMRHAGWRQAFTYQTTSVWFRPAAAEHAATTERTAA